MTERRRGRPKQQPIERLELWPKPTMTTGELAKYWGFHIQTIRAWVTKGDLEAIHTPGARGSYRIKVTSAIAFERRSPHWQRRSA